MIELESEVEVEPKPVLEVELELELEVELELQGGRVTDQIHSTPSELPVQVLLVEGAQLARAPEPIA